MVRVVNPAWWDLTTTNGKPLRACLARHDIPSVFTYLKSRGFSWAAIATLTGLGASRVSEIAAGRRTVSDYLVLERIAEGLRIPRHYMGLALDDQAHHHRHTVEAGPGLTIDHRQLLGTVASIAVGAIPSDVHRWLPEPQAIAVPAVVTIEDVTTLRAVTAFHRQVDAANGGGACLQSARGYLSWATNLLHANSANQQVADMLPVALADLHNLVGWVAHDLDQHDTARRHLTQSLVLARQSNALPLLANSLYRLGRVSLHQNHPDEALHLFGLGQLAAQHAGCRASVAILHANTAWAHAMLGAADQVVDSLARARAELDRVDPDTAPAWTHFALADADSHGISALAYTTLAHHDEHRQFADLALNEAHQAVRLRRAEDRRSHVFDLISVAAASTLTGEFTDAAVYGTRAMTMAEDCIRSARVRDRLASLWQTAAPHADRHPELGDLGSRIRVLRAS